MSKKPVVARYHEMENYYFETDPRKESRKIYILVIYDIINNKRRTKFAKAMEGYGMRVQKSCFEAYLTTALYDKIIKEIPDHIDLKEDSVRVYRMVGAGEVTLFGINVEPKAEDLIII